MQSVFTHIIGPSWVLVPRWTTACYWGAGRRPKSGPKHGPTQPEVRACPMRPGLRDLFCHRPAGSRQERPGTVRVTGTASADATNGAQRGAVMFEGPKLWVPASDGSEGERVKREQFNRLMPELKAQI